MAPKYILEQFLQQELLINITEHEVSSVGQWSKGRTISPGCDLLSVGRPG